MSEICTTTNWAAQHSPCYVGKQNLRSGASPEHALSISWTSSKPPWASSSEPAEHPWASPPHPLSNLLASLAPCLHPPEHPPEQPQSIILWTSWASSEHFLSIPPSNSCASPEHPLSSSWASSEYLLSLLWASHLQPFFPAYFPLYIHIYSHAAI